MNRSFCLLEQNAVWYIESQATFRMLKMEATCLRNVDCLATDFTVKEMGTRTPFKYRCENPKSYEILIASFVYAANRYPCAYLIRSIHCLSHAFMIFAIYFVQLQNRNNAKGYFQHLFNKLLESSRAISPVNWLNVIEVSSIISPSINRFWSAISQSHAVCQSVCLGAESHSVVHNRYLSCLMVLCPTGLMTIFYSLEALGAFRPLWNYTLSESQLLYDWWFTANQFLSSKKWPHFKICKCLRKKKEHGHESREGPKPIMSVLARTSSYLPAQTLCHICPLVRVDAMQRKNYNCLDKTKMWSWVTEWDSTPSHTE
jgi:hypothetical protein